MMGITVTTLMLGIIAILIAHILTHYRRAGKMIDKIPGPRHYPIIGNILDILLPPEDLWVLLRKYADAFYPIYKLWVCHWPVVVLRHPDDAEILLSSQQHIDKSLFYDFLQPWLGTGLLTSTGTKWRIRRKILTPAFHFKVLQEFTDVLVENSEHMVNSLKKEGGEIVKDLVPFLAQHTLNAICETAMGTALQNNDPLQQKYRKSVKQMGDFLYHRSIRPWLKNSWIFALTKMGQEQIKSLKVLHHFTSKIIKERKEYHETTMHDRSVAVDEISLQKKKLAMLDLLIAVQKRHNNIDDFGIREEVDTFIFEGHDTTAMGMCFVVLLLAEHEEIQARARAEIDDIFKQCNGKLGMNELQKMFYLDRCIKESFRLFPAVPAISRSITEDMELKNYTIPRGTIVNVHIYDLHRDPNFWPEPLVYDPDRFLPERIQNRHPFSYVPFSAGPRNCIGQKFAMLEVKTVLAQMLHNFYLKPLIECRKIPMLPDLVLKAMKPLDVKFVPIARSH